MNMSVSSTKYLECLAELEKLRIIRNNNGLFELVHDTVAAKIAEKRTEEEKKFFKDEKILADAYSLYNSTKSLMSKSEYLAIKDNLKKFNLSEQEATFLKKSIRGIRLKKIYGIGIVAIIIISLSVSVITLFIKNTAQEKLLSAQREMTSLKKTRQDDIQRRMADSVLTLSSNLSKNKQKESQWMLNLLDTALVIFRNVKDTAKFIQSVLEKGKLYASDEQLMKADSMFKSALSLAIYFKRGNEFKAAAYEQIGSIAERQNDYLRAKENYLNASRMYNKAGQSLDRARLLETLGFFEEKGSDTKVAEKYYDSARMIYEKIHNSDGLVRTEAAIEKLRRYYLPWGYLTDLKTGTIYEMRGEKISIGRNAVGINNDLPFKDNLISRRHIEINRDYSIEDMRSRNGTTINSLMLPFGTKFSLKENDLISLSGIEILLFNKEVPDRIEVPKKVWGILITNDRKFIYLTKQYYYLRFGNSNIICTETNSVGTKMTFRFREGKVELMDVKDEWKVIYSAKVNDYEYSTLIIPDENEWVESISQALEFVILNEDRTKVDSYGPSCQLIIR